MEVTILKENFNMQFQGKDARTVKSEQELGCVDLRKSSLVHRNTKIINYFWKIMNLHNYYQV